MPGTHVERWARAVTVQLASGAREAVVWQAQECAARHGERPDSTGQAAFVPGESFEGQCEVQAVLHAATDVGGSNEGGTARGVFEGFDESGVRGVLEKGAKVCAG